jgi:hypothetical protein
MGQEFLRFIAGGKDGVLCYHVAASVRFQTHLLGIRVIFLDERSVENAGSLGGCQGQQRVCQSMAIELRSSIRDEGGRP